MAKQIWVKNTGNTSIKVKAVLKAATETTEEMSKEVIFERYKVNAQSGLVESNGYTPIDKDIYTALLEKKMFKDLVDRQTLVAYDTQPDDAITPAARIQLLSARVLDLEGTVNALTEENAALKKDGGSKASKDKIAELEKALNDANDKIA